MFYVVCYISHTCINFKSGLVQVSVWSNNYIQYSKSIPASDWLVTVEDRYVFQVWRNYRNIYDTDVIGDVTMVIGTAGHLLRCT